MRKIFVIGICAFLLLWISAVNYSQEETATGDTGDSQADVSPNNVEETLIDFTTFEDRVEKSGVYGQDEARGKYIKDLDNKNPKEVDPTTLAPAYEIQASDLKYDRWLVQLNSSANTIKNRRWSYAKKVTLKSGKTFEGKAGSSNAVLGVRIHFPSHKFNAYAKICPPYEIRAYDPNGKVVSRKQEGKYIGVIDNVGDIKRMTLDVSGRNFRHGVAVRLKDPYDEVTEYFMGYLYYANWRKLTWENPNYITSVDHRELFRIPLYPREVPYKKFDSLIVYRPGQSTGGDFVVYFRKVDMWFDFAIPPETLADLDIDDEDQWGILAERARKKKRIETLKAREKIELMRQEARRLGKNAQPKDITKTGTDAEESTEPTGPTD